MEILIHISTSTKLDSQKGNFYIREPMSVIEPKENK